MVEGDDDDDDDGDDDDKTFFSVKDRMPQPTFIVEEGCYYITNSRDRKMMCLRNHASKQRQEFQMSNEG